MVFAEGQKFMFAKYGVTLACMLAMQINVCVNCVSTFTFFPRAYSTCMCLNIRVLICARVCACWKAGVCYI